MKRSRSCIRYFICMLTAYVGLMIIGGCGGGSDPLTIQGVAFRGRLMLAPESPLDDPLPLGGVRISLMETGDTTTTNSDGSYVLQTTESLSSAEFFFFGSGVNASFTLTDIPVDAISVSVDFEVNPAGDTVTSTGVVVENGDVGEGDDQEVGEGDEREQ